MKMVLDENTEPMEFIRHYANSITEVDPDNPDQAIRTRSGDIIVPIKRKDSGMSSYVPVASAVHSGFGSDF